VEDRLEIHAANGRDLYDINLSAPRLLRPASGDLAVQTVSAPVSDEKPAIGGLLLWKDKKNYLRLDRGTRGEREICFRGCLENKDVIIGRGLLPIGKSADLPVSKWPGRISLRLERAADRVDAFCSADGENWFTVGHIGFPVEDPIQVGLCAFSLQAASGNLGRTVYHGAYPDGTAIRFESFQLWAI
jgi:hypothetical protein